VPHFALQVLPFILSGISLADPVQTINYGYGKQTQAAHYYTGGIYGTIDNRLVAEAPVGTRYHESSF
jgi:hypothetical protein